MNRKLKKERSKRIKHQQSIQKNLQKILLLSLPSDGSETITGSPGSGMTYAPLSPEVIAWFENQSPSIPFGCRGCRHLHGRTYEGVLTVCGMHSFGLENCPDFVAKPTSPKTTASGGKSVLFAEIIVEFLAKANF